MLKFFYGENSFVSERKIAHLKKNFLKNNSGANSFVFDMEDEIVSLEKLREIIVAGGLFSDKKLILLKYFLEFADKNFQDTWLEYLKASEEILNDDNLLLIMLEKNNPRKNNKLFKFLQSKAESEECFKLNESQLREFIRQKISAGNREITTEAVNLLVLGSGGNLWKVENEINKLINFKRRLEKITEEDVKLLADTDTEANIFETVEAISSGNKRRALELLHYQISQGDDPFYILSMYIYQFRNLLKVADFYFQGVTNQYEIAKLTKMHPFVVKKSIEQVRSFDLKKLKEIYCHLEKIDREAKSGKMNIDLLLDLFVVKI